MAKNGSLIRNAPPSITITTPDDDSHPLNDPADMNLESAGTAAVGGRLYSRAQLPQSQPPPPQSSSLANLERESQQMIVATSSGRPSAVDNQPQRHRHHELLAMNGHRNNATSAAPSTTSVVQNHHLALTYFSHHEHLHPILQQQQETRIAELPTANYRASIIPNARGGNNGGQDGNTVFQVPIRARDALATTLSALYGKLIVVMGIAFPMAEVISTYIPPSFYEVFYLYLYIVSMVFLLFMYVTLLWGRPKFSVQQLANNLRMQTMRKYPPPPPESVRDSGEESDHESDSEDTQPQHRRSHVSIVIPPSTGHAHSAPAAPPRRHSFLMAGGSSSGSNKGSSHGSFYLRMGAVGKC